jgi:N-acetylmuramic acid 6-phosphate etherase
MLKHLKTEQVNPRSQGLDTKSTLGMLRVLNHEDATVARAVQRALPHIARSVDAIVSTFRRGGRLFYVGAGTSGRLGVLDASECPPTFGTRPSMVQGLIAGGRRALVQAVEGAEDQAAIGARDLANAGLRRDDVVVGISASGRTPYVLGAIRFARRRGAVTVGLTSNRRSPLASQAQLPIVVETGPEALTGSTRLKAGTAQKMVLNMLSTASMVQIGKVFGNRMVFVTATNEKLRKRRTRILQETAGVSASTAEHALRQTNHNLPLALIMLKTGSTAAAARRLLEKSGGSIRKVLASAYSPRRSRPSARRT